MKRKAWIVVGVLVGLGLIIRLLEGPEETVSPVTAIEDRQPEPEPVVTVAGELSEEQKKELFKLMVSAEADAREKAEEKFPETSTVNAILEQAEWEDALRERSWSALATEYGVTMDDIAWLAQEGIEKGWPKK